MKSKWHGISKIYYFLWYSHALTIYGECCLHLVAVFIRFMFDCLCAWGLLLHEFELGDLHIIPSSACVFHFTVLLLITILYTHFLIFITGTTNSSSCTISQLFKYPSAKKPSHIKSQPLQHFNEFNSDYNFAICSYLIKMFNKFIFTGHRIVKCKILFAWNY